MKLKLFLTLILFSVISGARAQQTDTPFAYPAVPDSISNFNDRADYFVSHFWDRVDLKRAFSSKEKMARAFSDFIAPMGITQADTAYSAVDRLMHRLDRQPADQLFIVSLAESALYSDSASLPADELYTRFLGPLLANKKIDKTAKLRYQAQFDQLSNSLIGHPLGELRFTDREGRSVRFIPREGQALIIYFNDPDCDDCHLTRVRLAADTRANELIEQGELAILALTPGEPDERWKEKAKELPEGWLAGADPDLDMKLDLRAGVPSFYLVDEHGIIRAKALTINNLLTILGRI